MIKSKFAVIGIGALLCCVPAVAFFTLRDQNDSLGTYKEKVNWPVGAESGHFRATLKPAVIPLKQGNQSFTLDVENTRTQKPVQQTPKVEIVMPMGTETMRAPMTITKTSQPGQYQIKADLEMAGDWDMHIKPDTTPDTINLKFKVAL